MRAQEGEGGLKRLRLVSTTTIAMPMRILAVFVSLCIILGFGAGARATRDQKDKSDVMYAMRRRDLLLGGVQVGDLFTFPDEVPSILSVGLDWDEQLLPNVVVTSPLVETIECRGPCESHHRPAPLQCTTSGSSRREGGPSRRAHAPTDL